MLNPTSKNVKCLNNPKSSIWELFFEVIASQYVLEYENSKDLNSAYLKLFYSLLHKFIFQKISDCNQFFLKYDSDIESFDDVMEVNAIDV